MLKVSKLIMPENNFKGAKNILNECGTLLIVAGQV
jgi:hypothetical protein